MASIEAAVDRIKRLECPTGDLTDRVASILADHQITPSGEIDRLEGLDGNGAQAYRVTIARPEATSIIFKAKSGNDDYVAIVTDAYIE